MGRSGGGLGGVLRRMGQQRVEGDQANSRCSSVGKGEHHLYAFRPLVNFFRSSTDFPLFHLTVFCSLCRGYIQFSVKGGLPLTFGEIEDLELPRLFKLSELPAWVDPGGDKISGEYLSAWAKRFGLFSSSPVSLHEKETDTPIRSPHLFSGVLQPQRIVQNPSHHHSPSTTFRRRLQVRSLTSTAAQHTPAIHLGTSRIGPRQRSLTPCDSARVPWLLPPSWRAVQCTGGGRRTQGSEDAGVLVAMSRAFLVLLPLREQAIARD